MHGSLREVVWHVEGTTADGAILFRGPIAEVRARPPGLPPTAIRVASRSRTLTVFQLTRSLVGVDLFFRVIAAAHKRTGFDVAQPLFLAALLPTGEFVGVYPPNKR